VADAALIVLASAGGMAVVATSLLWRRSARQVRVLRSQLESTQEPRRLLSRDAVKAVIGTAALVMEKGIGGAIRTSIEDLLGWAEVERPDLVRMASGDGTITIAFSDIEGSTELNEQLGDRSWMKVLGDHNRIISDCVGHHDGHVVKSQGDGFMVAFANPDAAVRWAIDVQRSIAGGRRRPAQTPIHVRIGIHRGDAVRSALSADLEPLVGDGQAVELKGFPGRHDVFAVSWSGIG
jgi:adenylate cyclase